MHAMCACAWPCRVDVLWVQLVQVHLLHKRGHERELKKMRPTVAAPREARVLLGQAEQLQLPIPDGLQTAGGQEGVLLSAREASPRLQQEEATCWVQKVDWPQSCAFGCHGRCVWGRPLGKCRFRLKLYFEPYPSEWAGCLPAQRHRLITGVRRLGQASCYFQAGTSAGASHQPQCLSLVTAALDEPHFSSRSRVEAIAHAQFLD